MKLITFGTNKETSTCKMQILRYFPFTNSCFRKLKFCVKNNQRKILWPSELHKAKGLDHQYHEHGLENNEWNALILSDF